MSDLMVPNPAYLTSFPTADPDNTTRKQPYKNKPFVSLCPPKPHLSQQPSNIKEKQNP